MRNNIIYGNIQSLPAKHLGKVQMRIINAANAFKVTFMHESLPPYSCAPCVTHNHTIELTYITKGKMIAHINGKRMKLCEGDYLFIPAGMEHRFETRASKVEAVSIFSPTLNLDKPDAKILFTEKS